MELSNLIPSSIELWFAMVMILASLITSAISAALGLGGGILLIAIMGLGMPLAALVPVHGAVQLGSNAGRTFVQWRHITYWVLIWFGAGSILGAVIAGRLTLEIPETLWRLCLGFFILIVTWMPKPKFRKAPKPIVFLNGVVGAILAMFFGATGPLVMAVNAPHAGSRHGIVATHAAAMTLQHSLKILVFGFLGFAFTAWLPLMVAMIVSGYIGTIIGSKLLDQLPEALFKKLLKATVTLLAITLIAQVLIS
ncbi:MAG: TSUP family transporter [Hyphomicrobiales bacterium]